MLTLGFLAVLVAGGALFAVTRDPEPEPDPVPTTTSTGLSTTTDPGPPTSVRPTVPLTAPATVPTVPMSTIPPATPPPVGTGSTAAAPVVGEVNRTCGSGGSGDCFLSVRSAPDSDAREIVRLSEGDAVVITCTVTGASVKSSVLGRTTNVWARTPDGTFVSMAFVDAPGFDPFTNSHPC